MHWFKENWFKLAIICTLLGFLAVHSYQVYQENQPKNLKEKLWQEIQDRMP